MQRRHPEILDHGKCPSGGDPIFGKPAPSWLREASVFNGWYFKWNDKMLDRVEGFPMSVTNDHGPGVISKLHARGVRVTSYAG